MEISIMQNTGFISQNYAVINEANKKLIGGKIKDLQAKSSGKMIQMSEEEVKAAYQKAQNVPKTLCVDGSEFVKDIYNKTKDNITYEVEGVTFTNAEMKSCKEVMKNAIAALPVQGSDLDYEDYAVMGIAVNIVNSYAKENLTEEQADVFNGSMEKYLDGLVQAEQERQENEGCFTDNTEGVGSTGMLNSYYNVRSTLSNEAAESLKKQMKNLPEQTKQALLANLEGAMKRGSVVQSASNKELAFTIKSLFATVDIKEEKAVNDALEQYKELMTPAYRANGIENTVNSNSLTHVLNQDVNRFTMQITNGKALLSHVAHTFQTTGEQGNKVTEKLSKEETLATGRAIRLQHGDDVIVEFSGDGMAALVESKKGALDNIEPKQDLEAKNAAFQKEIIHLDRSANHLPEYSGIYDADKAIATAVENCSKEEKAFVYNIIRQNFLVSNTNSMTEEERQANISLGMKKAEYAAKHYISEEQRDDFLEAMESVAKLASAGKADKNGTMDYGINKRNYLGEGSNLVYTDDPLDIMRKMDTDAYAKYQEIKADRNNENSALDALKYMTKWYANTAKQNANLVEEYHKKSEDYRNNVVNNQKIDTTFSELDVTDATAFLESLKNFQRKNPNFLTDIIHRECQYLQKIS